MFFTIFFFYYTFFLSCIQMSENTYLTHYQRNKERLKNQARDKYRNLSEEEKNKKYMGNIMWE